MHRLDQLDSFLVLDYFICVVQKLEHTRLKNARPALFIGIAFAL